MPNLGDIMPNFQAHMTDGTANGQKINFHDWLAGSWAILFSHPADYTPVCTTELGMTQTLHADFEKRKVKVAALSLDSVEHHNGWIEDIKAYTKCSEFPFPIIAGDRALAVQLGMLDPDELDSAGMPVTARAVFIIGPDKKMKLSLLYPATTGRNFDEILRVIDSLQLTAVKKVATPVNWKNGDAAMVLPNLTEEQCKELFCKDGHQEAAMPSGKHYMRFTKDYK